MRTRTAARRGMAWAERAGNHKQRLSALRMLAAAQVSRGDVDSGKALVNCRICSNGKGIKGLVPATSW